MSRLVNRISALSPGRRLAFVFLLTMVVPGMWLAFFGLRTIIQEQRIERQQARERLVRALEIAERQLSKVLEQCVENVSKAATAESPAGLEAALRAGAVYFRPQPPRAFPPGSILYSVGNAEIEP